MTNVDIPDSLSGEYGDISACWECAVKHVTSARVEYFEYLQDNESIRDLMWCIGDLGCAEKHLISLAPDLADAVRFLRKRIMSENISLGLFDEVVMIVCSTAELFKDRGLRESGDTDKNNSIQGDKL